MATNQERQETLEYSNFKTHYYKLMYAIEDPLPLAARLFSLGIIEHAVLQRVSITPALPSLKKSVILLSAVEAQIRTEPSKFHVFLKALKEEPSLQQLAESMEAMAGQPSRKRSSGEDESEASSAKKQKRSRCGECIGCYRKDDCGECTACKDKLKFGGPGKGHQTCRYRECQRLKFAKFASGKPQGRCGKCIGCTKKNDCGQCAACKHTGGAAPGTHMCIFRQCQRLIFAPNKSSSSAESSEQSPQVAISTVHTQTIDLTLATPQQQPGEHSLHTVSYSYPPLGQPTRKQSQLEHKCDANRTMKQRHSSGNDLESKVSEIKIPELKGPNTKGLESNISERKDQESTGPKIKGPEEKASEKKASKKDSGKKSPEKKRRLRCGQCIGCLQKDDCGECVVCKDKVERGGPGRKHQPCIYRACQMLKYTTAPAIPKQSKKCGKCIGCLRKDDCGKCKACIGKKKFGGTDTYYKQCIYRVCQKVRYTPKIPIKGTASEMSPHAPMKNAQGTTSDSGACIPKLWMDAGGPGITTSSEHVDTTAESVFMKSVEDTISDELTQCKDVTVKMEFIKTEGDATATTEPTKSEVVTGIMKREEDATANQGLTKGESSCTTKDVSPKRKDDAIAENEPSKNPLEHDLSLATHDDIAGPQDDELDTRPTLPELLKFPSKSGMMNIPQMIGTNYGTFGTLLLNDKQGEKIDAIVDENSGAKEINLAILKRWLRGEGEQPATWRTLVQVLKDSDLTALAEEIEAVKLPPIM